MDPRRGTSKPHDRSRTGTALRNLAGVQGFADSLGLPGAFQLAKAGLLRSKTITTHWSNVAAFRTMFPDFPVQENTRRVDAGEIVTSAGSSAGLDMTLHLVARLESEELAV